MFTAFRPPEHGTRERRAQFPDESWIGFPSLGIEVAAKSQADVTVTTAVPQEQKWAGGYWEIWLEVTPRSSDLLAAKLRVRLLVSASGTRFNIGLVAGIAVGVVLLGYGGYYYFKRRARPEEPLIPRSRGFRTVLTKPRCQNHSFFSSELRALSSDIVQGFGLSHLRLSRILGFLICHCWRKQTATSCQTEFAMTRR